jgi:hypothetical protein
MTPAEQQVWAAAWAASLRATRTAGRALDVRVDIAKEDALEAILELRRMAEDPELLASDDLGDVLLRQTAGEPDCFILRRPPPVAGSVYIVCQHPMGPRCEACAAFGNWPEEKP